MKKLNLAVILTLTVFSSTAFAASPGYAGNNEIPKVLSNQSAATQNKNINNTDKSTNDDKKIINLNEKHLSGSYSTYGKIVNQTTLISKEIKLAEEKLKLAKINKELEREGGQAENISSSSITLDGVFGTKGDLIGLISLNNGKALSVKGGQKIYNIKIINISDNSVTLSRNGVISKIPLITLSNRHNIKNQEIKKK